MSRSIDLIATRIVDDLWTRKSPCVRSYAGDRSSAILRTLRCFPGASDDREHRSGKQKAAPKGRFNRFNFQKKTGAGEAIRTPDPNLGKVVLYP